MFALTAQAVTQSATSINHAGCALYVCAAVLFIAQFYGVLLSVHAQITIVILAIVTTTGSAGIPAASLIGIVVILAAVGLPSEAIGIILVVDRFLDMARTSVNVFANAACAVIIDGAEGETGILQRRLAKGR